ncbi:MAG: beta-ketoacyl-ACP synthase II [Chloroflexota bacterium]
MSEEAISQPESRPTASSVRADRSDATPGEPGHCRDQRGRRRVVVTGMGVITPLGLCVDDFWRALVAGVSGADRISVFDASAYPTQIAHEVKGFEATQYIEPKEARRMSRVIHFAIAATRQALDQARFEVDRDNGFQVGVILGTGIGSFSTVERECQVLFERGGMKINPFFLPMMLPNMLSGQVARIFGARGYNSAVATACASGAQAMGEALEAIRRGAAEVMITGGSEASICEFALAAFCVMRALSTRNDDPKRASRPFDRDRDGFVPSEGCGVLILESLEHALRRDAPILAEVVGYASTCDAYHVVAPEPNGEGAARVMELALKDAGLKPTDVDYINAHGTSTPLNDKTETLAIKRVFGDYAYRVPISATKSMIGHLIGAAGPVEAVACIQTINDCIIHPTINYETPDPECDLDYVPNVAREARVDVALSNSFGFGGHNASLVFKRFSP